MTSANPSRPSTAAVATALLIVYVVWGSTYLGIAIMIETLPPLLAAGVRYATAGLLMLGALVAYARLRRSAEPIERPTRAHWRSAFIIGTLLLLGGNGGVVLAELYIPSGIAAVLIAAMPIWLSLFDAILTRRLPSRLVIGGLMAGIVGVAVLIAPLEEIDAINPIGVGLCLLAEISWAAGSIYARRAPLPRSALLGTGLEMLAGGLVMVLAGSLLGEIGRTNVEAFSLRSLLALAYLIVFGSIVAFTAYTWLLANVPVSTVGTYAYVNPIVAVALGAIILSEPITPRTIIASVLIIGAVVAMVSGRPREVEVQVPVPPDRVAREAD
ncbi:MAG TPA: EamA family transporter [Candidatus Limnocylindrales bacterium]|nr:EamA family transporter [Candidatus Limnocylindrales bacterium]